MRKGILSLLSIGVLLFSVQAVYAWTGPSGTAPNNNVSAPINVGSTDQIKSAAIGVDGLAVFGNSILQAASYLNWGATSGINGYGIRESGGALEFKNNGGTGGDNGWQTLQAIVSGLLGGGAGSWTLSGNNIYNNNSGNVGIGTASPTAKLTVMGNGDFRANVPVVTLVGTGDGSQYGAFNLSTGGNNTWGIQFLQSGDLSFGYYPSGSPAMQITQAGNVGIANTAPAYKLDVSGSANATSLCIAGDCKTAWPAAGSTFTNSGSAGYVAKITDATSIGNSIISDNGSTVTVGGNLTMTGSDLYMGSTDVIRRDGSNAYLFPWGSGYSGNTVFLGGGTNTNLWVTGDAYVAARGLNVSQLASKVGAQFWYTSNSGGFVTCPSGSVMIGYNPYYQDAGELYYLGALCQWI